MLKMIGKKLKDQRGLTLVELLAVVVILGIISAIAIPSIGNIIEKSRYDAAKADAIQAINAAKLYVASEGTKESISNTDLTNYYEGSKNWSAFTITVSGDTYTFSGTKDTNAKFKNTPIITGTVSTIDGLKYTK